MRVMVLGLRGFPHVQGGVEQHGENLYPLLSEAGCKIDVITRSSYVSHDLRTWKGITFHRLWAPKIAGIEAFIHSIIGVIYAGFMRPDILHIHAIGPAIVAPLGRILGLRVVVTHHGPDYDREKWGRFARWLLRLGERWGMSYANQRIVISEVIRKLILDKYRLDSVVIPNGVVLPDIPDSKTILERFSLSVGRYVLLVSRFVPEKRHIDLIEAFSQSDLMDWKLVLVGGLDKRDKYCSQVLALAEELPGVVFTDFLSGRDLKELYAHAGIFVLPSSHEGLPIALLEALSYGLPVLASNIPANLEVDLPAQHYFPLGDIPALTNAIRLWVNQDPSNEQRKAWREWVGERYHWPSIAQHTLAVYAKAARS